LNLPGRNHVTERRVDSRDDIVETFFRRKDSYSASEEDMPGLRPEAVA
jgi:hypothetical protein